MTREMLLLHGAWQGAWVFERIIPHLEALGWRCQAVDLPENGCPGAPPGEASLEAYVAHCAAVGPERMVVLAHSGSGVIASQLAEDHPGRVEAIVYVAGMMLPSGMAFEDLARRLAAEGEDVAGVNPHLVRSADGLFTEVPPAVARRIFLHDCPDDVAAAGAASLTPQRETGRVLRARLTAERFGRVPRVYIEALCDRSVVLAAQRRMQTLTPPDVLRSIATGHAPHISQPQALAGIVDEALASCAARARFAGR
jgi:pimeloyl-ACP methyl ester carboxylesterase